MNIKFIPKRIAVLDLIQNANSIYQFIIFPALNKYAAESNLFNHYELPVVTKKNVVLTHKEDIEAALLNGVDKIEVLVADGLEEDDEPRFIAKSLYYFDQASKARPHIIEYFENYLKESDKGKKWATELQDEGHSDINDKLGAIFNCSKETIKREKRMAQNPVDNSKKPSTIIDEKTLELCFLKGKWTIKIDGKGLDNLEPKLKQKDGKIFIEVNLKEEAATDSSSKQIENI